MQMQTVPSEELPSVAVEPRPVRPPLTLQLPSRVMGFMQQRQLPRNVPIVQPPHGESAPAPPTTPRKFARLGGASATSSANDGGATPSTTCSDASPRTECGDEASPVPELRVCRFCLCCEEAPFHEVAFASAGECTDAFVHPCPCRGSTKFVHLDCLVQHFVAQGSWHNFRCPTCKQPYEGRALRELAEVSRARMTEQHGARSPQVGHSLCFLAQAYTQLGNLAKSKETLESGLEITTSHYGAGHVATAAMLSELATVCGKLGDIVKQKQLLEQSLDIKEKFFGMGHISTAVTLNNLATAYSEMGDMRQERILLERSLEIKEKHYGKGHVQTTAALVNLAGVYSELGDFAKAQGLLENSLLIEERHFGEGHVETAITLNNLALACADHGDVCRMRDLLVRCLSIKEQHFGLHHRELCLTLANLGLACAALSEVSAARRCCERALQVCELRSGRRYGIILLRLACVHAFLGEQTLPEELTAAAVAALQEALNPKDGAQVIKSEGSRVGRIWSAVGRSDLAGQCQGLLRRAQCSMSL